MLRPESTTFRRQDIELSIPAKILLDVKILRMQNLRQLLSFNKT